MLNEIWKNLTFVGFDTETTGKYPLTAEICEIAAVKWRNGVVVDELSALIKPAKPMGEAVIKIHGITNEMVENAPPISAKIAEFHRFIQGCVPIAHHAPFDLGFIAIEFERAGLRLPAEPVICSSLLSRKVITDSENHRLQTLIRHLGLEQGQAHRALDDARACLNVAMRCMERIGEKTLHEVMAEQKGPLSWARFSMRELEERDTAGPVVQATREMGEVEILYSGGSRPGQTRRVRPLGVVRSLDGDYFVATDSGTALSDEANSKRFLLDKVVSAKRVLF